MFQCPSQVEMNGSPQGHCLQRPVFFLPGWGFDGRIIRLIQPALPWCFPVGFYPPETQVDELLSFLDNRGIDRICLIGWSLGAVQALVFAKTYPKRIAALHLISMRDKWPDEEINQIRRELWQDYKKCLITFFRKCFLGHREAYEYFTSTLQTDYLMNAKLEVLQQGLTYLQKARIRAVPGISTHIIHGRNDIIVPLTQMAHLQNATVEIIDHVGHLPFLSPVCSLRTHQKKETIRQKFSLAANTYDNYALIQNKVAGMLADRLTTGQRLNKMERILEIGCGTGNYTKRLSDIFPEAEILALDFSRGMINQATRKLQTRNSIHFICEDAERYLEHAKGQKYLNFNLITSNATLQWFAGLRQSFCNISKLLGSDGLLLCSLFGPRTLEELGQGLASIFGSKTILAATHFPGQEKLYWDLHGLFSQIEIEEKIIRKQYSSLDELLVQIKKTGTTGWRGGKPLTFTRSRLTELRRWFEERAGGCQVTYQLFFLRCEK